MNEEENVEAMYKKLVETLDEIDFKMIYVNDGSTDKTYEKLKEIYNNDKKRVAVINFSRNFGKDAAIFAGLSHSDANYSVIIDGDLQQNPKYLLDMMNYLDKNENTDVVAMIQAHRKENIMTRFLKWGFYTFINMISDTRFAKGVSDFRMFRRNAVEAIVSLSENNRFSKGIFSWIGFETHIMEYEVEARTAGKTKFNFFSQWKYAFNGIINFSIKPLRLATVFGFLFAFIAFIYFIVIVVQTITQGTDVPGYPSLLCAILFLGGIQLIAIGILGEYMSKTYLEAKKRPVYVAKNKLGLKDEDIL
jgi:glycosyltransferase involved in cell wall biosynthesis